MSTKRKKPAPEGEPFLTVKDVAEHLSMKPGQIYRLVSLGRLPFYRLNHKSIRFRASELEARMRKIREGGHR